MGPAKCRSCITTTFRQRRKLLLINLRGNACERCGYDRCVDALHFHHLDPSQKEYRLSSGNTRSLEKDLEEVSKCMLVCANCHAEIHHRDDPS